MELALAKLAISTLSPIIEKLGNYVSASYFGGDVTADEMEYLKAFVLFKIDAVFRKAELNPSDYKLRPLMERLQAAAFEAEDVLDLYEYEQIEYQVSSSPNFIKKHVHIIKEKLGFMLPKSPLRESLEKLLKFADEIEKLYPFIEPKTDMTQQNYKIPQGSTTTSIHSSPYFGRAKQCDIIIDQFLLHESHANSINWIKRVPIIAIKGLGGSGKTFTAQHVYNDDRVKNCFDLRMWVHVSRSFDVCRLTKEIIESAKDDKCPPITNLDVLQKKLKKSVSKRKNFLLVLDDIWCENREQWDQLLSPLNEVGGKGSKIIITTRMEKVASILQVEEVIPLEELKAEDCWSILKHYAFNNHEEIIEDQELVNVGNQIISKVKSSPLALRVVGCSLNKGRRSVDEWEQILKRDMLKETMDVLLFSFQHLPSHLQRCFAYCSLFPKGYKFHFGCYHREQLLIPLWISQGFIENTSQLTLEEEALNYIKELLSYSFFEMLHNDYFVIHDLFHELAEKVSKKHCHRIEHEDSLQDIPTTCIHLLINRLGRSESIDISDRLERSESIDISDTLKLRNLRTLIILFHGDSTNIFENKKFVFQNLTKLRALHVDEWKIEVLGYPHIDKLKHLRYLYAHFGKDKKLPRSLVKLYHLQFLHLNMCIYRNDLEANTLPQDFGNLINLCSLKFYGAMTGMELDYLYYNSKEISIEKLKSLQNLSVFHPRKDSVNRMMPLKNIPLCGSLRVLNLENVKNKVEAAEAMLNQKRNLDELEFEWCSTSSSTEHSNTCKEVLEGLEPHSNLKKLSVSRYQGVKVASWMVKENWLPGLRTLKLFYCKNLKEVPFLPPGLEELSVVNCDELMQLPFVVNTLHNLQLANCPKLMLPSMSNKSLRLDCPKLTSLKILQYCTSYRSIIIQKCPMLMRDESLLVEGAVEGEIIKSCSQIKNFATDEPLLISPIEQISTDEPLLILVLVQQQAFSSITSLCLGGLQRRPFPPLLEDHFHQFSSLKELTLMSFKTLPNLEKLSSLETLEILFCPDVDLLLNLPISLQRVNVYGCPKLRVCQEQSSRFKYFEHEQSSGFQHFSYFNM